MASPWSVDLCHELPQISTVFFLSSFGSRFLKVMNPTLTLAVNTATPVWGRLSFHCFAHDCVSTGGKSRVEASWSFLTLFYTTSHGATCCFFRWGPVSCTTAECKKKKNSASSTASATDWTTLCKSLSLWGGFSTFLFIYYFYKKCPEQRGSASMPGPEEHLYVDQLCDGVFSLKPSQPITPRSLFFTISFINSKTKIWNIYDSD